MGTFCFHLSEFSQQRTSSEKEVKKKKSQSFSWDFHDCEMTESTG